MANQLGSDDITAANHNIANAFWPARVVQTFEKYLCLQGAQLTGLDDDCTSRRNRRRELETDEQGICVPRRNEARNPGRLQRYGRLAPTATQRNSLQGLLGFQE